jgi:hypothetical protein
MTSLFLTMKSILCLLMGAVLLAVTGCAGPTSGSSAALINAGGSSEGYTQASVPVHEWPEWGEAGETGFSGMVDYRVVLSDPGPF